MTIHTCPCAGATTFARHNQVRTVRTERSFRRYQTLAAFLDCAPSTLRSHPVFVIGYLGWNRPETIFLLWGPVSALPVADDDDRDGRTPLGYYSLLESLPERCSPLLPCPSVSSPGATSTSPLHWSHRTASRPLIDQIFCRGSSSVASSSGS